MELTKKQVNNFATKKDIAGVKKDVDDVKKDIAGVKKDVARIDKKVGDLDKKVDRVIIDQISTKEDIKEVKETMATKEDINKVLNALDKVIKDNDDIKVEQTANVAAHDRFEKRLTNIEGHVNLKPAV